MPDREKTIRALEGIGIALDMDGHHNDAQAVRDALAMLRDQDERIKRLIEDAKILSDVLDDKEDGDG